MLTYLLILLIPCMLLVVLSKAIWNKNICHKEMFALFGANLLMAVLSVGIMSAYNHSKMSDTQILSGIVTGKEKNKVSCSHSYSCNCRQSCSGSGNSRSCYQVCDTCYDHSFDIDWDVYSTVGTFTIDREDRQGLETPPRWSAVKIGEAASRTSSYQNPLLADKDTLFVASSESFTGTLPPYPNTYDYYRINRVIGSPRGIKIEDINLLLDEYLKTRASVKQVNIITVFTKHNPSYFNVLMSSWNGGKKNDVILVYGIDDTDKVVWFNSNSYAKGMGNRELHTGLRQLVLGEIITKELLTEQIKLIDNKYNRLSAEEFEYKTKDMEIPTGFVVFLFILNLIGSCVMIFNFKNN